MQKTPPQLRCPGSRAFTLADLTITIFIIGIVAAIAAPKYLDALDRYRVESAALQIQADLKFARRSAMSTSSSQTVRFTSASHEYTLVGLDQPGQLGQPYVTRLSEAPHQSKLVSVVLGDDADILFDRFGVPDSGGTVVVQSGSYQKTVVIDSATGKVSIP